MRQFKEFVSSTGTPHKVPVPIKDPKKCTHKVYASYSFDMMRVPTCWDCGKPMEGKQAEDSLKFYQSLIDNRNKEEQKCYDKNGYGFFYIKNSDGSYRQEYREKPKQSIWQIIKEEFFKGL